MRFTLRIIKPPTPENPKQSDIMLEGRNIEESRVTMEDMQKAIEVEQWLEKIYGYRFHIFGEPHETSGK